MIENIKYEDWREKAIQKQEVQDALDELEAAHLVAQLRIERQLTQEELAERVGTKQASIARLESGKTQPRLSFLRRVISALGARLELRVVKLEDDEQGESVSAEKRNVLDNQVIIIVGQETGDYPQIIPVTPATSDEEITYKKIFAPTFSGRAHQYDKSRMDDPLQ